MTKLGVSALGLVLAAAGFTLILAGEFAGVQPRFQRFMDRTGSSLLLAGAVAFTASRCS